MSEQPTWPSTPDDRGGWRACWAALGLPWRSEPEIDEQRQAYLAERRAVTSDIEKGIYPFRNEHGGITLTRADVEWLLATHESGGLRGPVDWDDGRQRRRDGLDLRGANLTGLDLRDLPLARLRGGLLPWSRGGARDEWLAATSAQREAAAIHLEGANLGYTHLEGAILASAHLEGARLQSAHLEVARLREAHLEGANLNGAYFDRSTNLFGARVSDGKHGAVLLADVRWGDANLGWMDWASVQALGNEHTARQRDEADGTRKAPATRLREYERAVREGRQVASVLRVQGLGEHADRFTYRAQVLQRAVLRRRRRWLRYLGNLLLDGVAGFGYRPLRSFALYAVIVLTFAVGYWYLGLAGGHPLAGNEALVVSLTAFHGRGFLATAFQPGDPQAALAAGEAVIGLLIEVTFIATFTQRFFAR